MNVTVNHGAQFLPMPAEKQSAYYHMRENRESATQGIRPESLIVRRNTYEAIE